MAQSAERIHTMHTRLLQEAEKMRKWKTSTEIEIKEKVKIYVITLFSCCLVFITGFDTPKGNPFFHVISRPFFFSLHRRKNYWRLSKQSILRENQSSIYRLIHWSTYLSYHGSIFIHCHLQTVILALFKFNFWGGVKRDLIISINLYYKEIASEFFIP